MNERKLKCPKCGTVFAVDEADYAAIMNQVKNEEFESELGKRMTELKKQLTIEQKAEELKANQAYQNKLNEKTLEISKKDAEIAELITQIKGFNETKKAELDSERAQMEKKIVELNAQIKAQELKADQTYQNKLNEKALEISKKDAKIAELQAQIKGFNETKKAELESERTQMEKKIVELNAQLKESNSAIELAVMKAQEKSNAQLQQKELEVAQLKNDVAKATSEADTKLNTVKQNYELQLKLKDEEVQHYKNFKAQLSTKAIGESLEIFCSNEFNKVRAISYPNAYFEKDNDVKEGTKGDFIFRDFADDTTEYISIMFEMKNESETTATKHKNEDFFAKLDKDRNVKKCEYAVLVSLLEQDNDLYNQGIVDVSHRYQKMFVVRPQFFMPIIALLTKASRNTIPLRKELLFAQQQSVDITNFENKLDTFRKNFTNHYDAVGKKFEEAIAEIDKSIKHLQNVRAALVGSEDKLRLANKDTEELTIRKLTYKNPTMKKKFEEARTQSQVDGD